MTPVITEQLNFLSHNDPTRIDKGCTYINDDGALLIFAWAKKA